MTEDGYVEVEVSNETYKKLENLRDEFGLDSVTEVVMLLMDLQKKTEVESDG